MKKLFPKKTLRTLIVILGEEAKLNTKFEKVRYKIKVVKFNILMVFK